MKLTRILSVAFLTTAMLACDVTNPGPVQDEFLALPAAQQGLINGAIRNVSELIGNSAYTMAILSREVFPGGQTGAWGHNVTTQGGHIQPGSFGGQWNDAQQARFIAETAIKRFTDASAPNSMMYQAHLWAGFAYRIMGELWCEAIVSSTDPDDTTPGTHELDTNTYFQRAVTNFTAALSFASNADEQAAARAGRAQAYLLLQDWSNAAVDAATVPDDFVFEIIMDDSEAGLYNDIYEASSGVFRSFTVQFTWFENYYDDGSGPTTGSDVNTGDPRAIWVIDPDNATATASLQGFPGGAVPYKPQRKYTERASNVRIASGWEMRLIEAEAILAQSQPFAGAMTLINQVRQRNISDIDGNPLAAWTAADATEAWTMLKRERAIELWLEGRRARDEMRWAAMSTPGAIDSPNWEDVAHPGHTPIFTANPRSYCYDIPTSERDQNPNIGPAG